MAGVQVPDEENSFEWQPLLNPHLHLSDPSHGITFRNSDSMRPRQNAVHEYIDPSGESDVFMSFEDDDDSEAPLSSVKPKLPHGRRPAGDPAPEPPVNRPINEEEDEPEEEENEEDETACTSFTSLDEWCIFLSCKLNVLVTPLRMPLRERKCLRSARTEGWRLLWSLVFPLAVGSVPLQLVWVAAQLIASFALFGLSVADCVSSKCNGWKIAYVSVSGVWMLLTLVDIVVCLVAIKFYRNTFLWKISPYFTVLRITYTVICLHIVVIGFFFIAGFEVIHSDEVSCLIIWPNITLNLKVQFGTSFASMGVFVDLVLLVVAIQFIRKCLALRNAYSAYGQPTVIAVGLYIIFELLIHLLLVTCAISFTLSTMGGSRDVDCAVDSLYIQVSAALSGALSVLTPLFGLTSIFFVDYLWFQEYLASVCLSVQSILQDREAATRLGIPENVIERLQERSQGIDHELLRRSIVNFKTEATFQRKLFHLCENPFSFVYSYIVACSFGTIIFVSLIFGVYDVFTIVFLITAASVFIILHLHELIFCFISSLLIVLPVIVLLPFLAGYMGVYLLLLPLYSSWNCCRCTHRCKRDHVP